MADKKVTARSYTLLRILDQQRIGPARVRGTRYEALREVNILCNIFRINRRLSSANLFSLSSRLLSHFRYIIAIAMIRG